jgi:hypothetical protein
MKVRPGREVVSVNFTVVTFGNTRHVVYLQYSFLVRDVLASIWYIGVSRAICFVAFYGLPLG